MLKVRALFSNSVLKTQCTADCVWYKQPCRLQIRPRPGLRCICSLCSHQPSCSQRHSPRQERHWWCSHQPLQCPSRRHLPLPTDRVPKRETLRGSNRSLFDFSIDFPMMLAQRAASRSPPCSKTSDVCTPSITDVLVVSNNTNYDTESGWFWSLSSLSPFSHTIGLAPQIWMPIRPLPLTSSRRPLFKVSNKIAIDESLSK